MAANVQSIDAIERMRLAVLKFGDQCDTGLEEVEGETRRMLDWLQNDRPKYWKEQIHRASDDLHQAKINLQRCLSYSPSEERPSCQEERAALKAAEARLAHCREKAERTKHWIREIQHEILEYQGRVGQLATCIEADIPQAAARLKRLVEQLEAYAAISIPGSSTPAGGTASARGSEEQSSDEGDEGAESKAESTDGDHGSTAQEQAS